jgi:hypothetical protein
VNKFAKTEDEDGLHPEYLIAAMPYAQAEEWQSRLRVMDEDQRRADRAVLLDQYLQNSWIEEKPALVAGARPMT